MVALWIGFIAFVLLVLVLDLAVINRRAHVISAGQAMRWSGAFLCLGLIFAGVVYFLYERDVIWSGMPHVLYRLPIEVWQGR
jgi:tellurite resistance protein TerC